jgi:hypothetical protein
VSRLDELPERLRPPKSALLDHSLDRHIGRDEGEHGPLAGRLVELLCGDDEGRCRAAERAAVRCLQARLELWDGILTAVG